MRHRQAVSLTEPNEADIDESGDDQSKRKPSMLRREPQGLVVPAFRSSLRRPPTRIHSIPTFSKSVHFDPHLERVRHFFQVERPLSVAAGSLPVESDNGDTESSREEDYNHSQLPFYEWEIITANFPAETYERLQLPVRVQKVALSPDNRQLIGTVAVANLAFNKAIVVRFTLDFWKTTSDMLDVYADDARPNQRDDGCDRFNFAIEVAELAKPDEKPMFFCVKYCVNDVEYWDNNNNYNFQVVFRKKLKPMSGQIVL